MTFGHFKRLLLFLFFFKVDFNNNKVNFFNDVNNNFYLILGSISTTDFLTGPTTR